MREAAQTLRPLPVLFHRKLDLHQMTFAMGESIAHLHALVARRSWEGGPATTAYALRGRLKRQRSLETSSAPRRQGGGCGPRTRLLEVGHHRAHDVPERGLWFISRRCASSCATT